MSGVLQLHVILLLLQALALRSTRSEHACAVLINNRTWLRACVSADQDERVLQLLRYDVIVSGVCICVCVYIAADAVPRFKSVRRLRGSAMPLRHCSTIKCIQFQYAVFLPWLYETSKTYYTQFIACTCTIISKHTKKRMTQITESQTIINNRSNKIYP